MVTHTSKFLLGVDRPYRLGSLEKPAQAVTAEQWVLLQLMRVRYSNNANRLDRISVFPTGVGRLGNTAGSEGCGGNVGEPMLCLIPGSMTGCSQRLKLQKSSLPG